MSVGAAAESFRQIGWNNITLRCSISWEFRVQGASHIVIEHNFVPILQLKWAKEVDKPQLMGNIQQARMTEDDESAAKLLLPLADRFQLQRLVSQKPTIVETVLICRSCGAAIHLQLLPAAGIFPEQCRLVLASLSCHRDDNKTLWTLQDTSFKVASDLMLQQSSFKAGLCWITLQRRSTRVQLIRLSPASERLARQPASEILRELCGTDDLTIAPNREKADIFATRTPTLWHQLYYRLRRQHPFVEAALRYLPDRNVLAGGIISAKETITPDTASNLLPLP